MQVDIRNIIWLFSMRRNRKKFKWVEKHNKYHRNMYLFLDPMYSLRSLFSGNNLRIVRKGKIKFIDCNFWNWSTVDLHYIGFWCTDYAPLKVIVRSRLLSATFSQASIFLFNWVIAPKLPVSLLSELPHLQTLHLDAFSDSELGETLKSQSEESYKNSAPAYVLGSKSFPIGCPRIGERERGVPSSVYILNP